MAKSNSNFLKFIKLASLVKKVADENPDIKERILNESESKSKNSWNKIQKWTSKNLFPEFKDKPLSKVTKKNVKDALFSTGVSKKQSCFNVFKIPTSDLAEIENFALEETLLSFPPNLQVEIDLDGKITTGIQQIKNISIVGNGELTTEIRKIYDEIGNIQFRRLRKKGKKQGDRGNCSYYIKVMAEKQELTADEEEREEIQGVNVSQLTKKQQEQRKQLKKILADKRKKRKKTKAKTRKFKTPSKVKSTKEDKKIEDKIKKSKEKGGEREKQIRGLINDLRQDVKDGLITKKFFQKEVAKLTKKLDKGGEI